MKDRRIRLLVKDIVIQTIFIIVAICFTVLIASASMRSQYTEYYESTLEDKADILARGAAMVLAEMHGITNPDETKAALDLLFSPGAGPETLYYALYEDGRLIAANTPDAYRLFAAQQQENENAGDAFVSIYRPVDEQGRYVIAVGVDYSLFLSFSQDMEGALYPAMLRGSALMAVTFAAFTLLSNLRKRKKAQMPEEQAESNYSAFIKTQLISFFVFLLLSIPFAIIFFRNQTVIRVGALIIGSFFMAIAAAHLFRLLKWFFLWYLKRPISSYSAQTLQFVMFLIIFLAQFSYAVQNGYHTQIELSRQDELRLSSMLTALTYGEDLQEAPFLDEKSEYFTVIHTDEGFRAVGLDTEFIGHSYDLLDAAWNAKSSVSGIRGGYFYGISAIAGIGNEVTALAGVRQPHTMFIEEIEARNSDFLLGMAATVLAVVFLFVELNKLLEAINRPLQKEERGLRYALGARSLVFLVTMSQFIPQYFFVLIVYDIFEHNPVSWLSADMAVTLPLLLTLPIMLFGKSIADRYIKLERRTAMTLGCVIGAAGFLLLGSFGNFYLFLIILVFTYMGVSMVYNGLWDYVIYASGFDYPELRSIKQHTVGGEFLGYTSGAVIGAMVYDQYGLFAALALSSGILLILGVLIRFMQSITSGIDEDAPSADEPSGESYTLIRFVFSKRIICYFMLLVLPFVVAPYFITQFSPLYAESTNLSPGAVSWTSLLQVIFVAYVSPKIVGVMSRRLSHAAVAIFSNILSATALVSFALMPGITTLYAASAMIGMAAGIGSTSVASGYYGMPEAQSYKKSRFVYFLLRSLGGQLGTILFTIVHAGSGNGGFILAIALPIAALSLVYAFISKRYRRVSL